MAGFDSPVLHPLENLKFASGFIPHFLGFDEGIPISRGGGFRNLHRGVLHAQLFVLNELVDSGHVSRLALALDHGQAFHQLAVLAV